MDEYTSVLSRFRALLTLALFLFWKEEEMEEMLCKCKYGPHNCEKRAQLYKHYPPVSQTRLKASPRLKFMFKLS